MISISEEPDKKIREESALQVFSCTFMNSRGSESSLWFMH